MLFETIAQPIYSFNSRLDRLDLGQHALAIILFLLGTVCSSSSRTFSWCSCPGNHPLSLGHGWFLLELSLSWCSFCFRRSSSVDSSPRCTAGFEKTRVLSSKFNLFCINSKRSNLMVRIEFFSLSREPTSVVVVADLELGEEHNLVMDKFFQYLRSQCPNLKLDAREHPFPGQDTERDRSGVLCEGLRMWFPKVCPDVVLNNQHGLKRCFLNS